MTNDEIKREIRNAFAGVQLGNGIGLWQAQAIDDYESQEVQQEKRAADEKEKWDAIPVDVLNRCESSLCFFDADGMRFHLPAFLIAEIDGAANCGPLFHLTELSDYAISKFNSLTEHQRNAVKLFLYWCLEQERYDFERSGIERALREYWEKPESLFDTDVPLVRRPT
jgi:hypothetical protein